MLAVVEQALDDVERGDVVIFGLFGEGEKKSVIGEALEICGSVTGCGETLAGIIVGGEAGLFA